MTSFKKLVMGAATAVSLLIMVGCANLSPTGTYGKMGATGQWIYNFDSTVDQSYQLIDAAEVWELQNHTYLRTNSPTLVSYFENVRTNAPKYFGAYSFASTTFKSVYGTPAQAAASNQVVTAFTVITNSASAVTTSMSNAVAKAGSKTKIN